MVSGFPKFQPPGSPFTVCLIAVRYTVASAKCRRIPNVHNFRNPPSPRNTHKNACQALVGGSHCLFSFFFVRNLMVNWAVFASKSGYFLTCRGTKNTTGITFGLFSTLSLRSSNIPHALFCVHHTLLMEKQCPFEYMATRGWFYESSKTEFNQVIQYRGSMIVTKIFLAKIYLVCWAAVYQRESKHFVILSAFMRVHSATGSEKKLKKAILHNESIFLELINNYCNVWKQRSQNLVPLNAWLFKTITVYLLQWPKQSRYLGENVFANAKVSCTKTFKASPIPSRRTIIILVLYVPGFSEEIVRCVFPRLMYNSQSREKGMRSTFALATWRPNCTFTLFEAYFTVLTRSERAPR